MTGPGHDEEATALNRRAWNASRYEAWEQSRGPPEAAAAGLVKDPRHALRRLLPHLGDVAGRRVLNLQGGSGRAAIALALLGAEVTVIDFAEENARYARAYAAAAGVALDYRVSDVMLADQLGLSPDFDWVVMELGILHYHADLDAFFGLCAAMSNAGGRLLLNEFHPVQRKLFSSLGNGDYFESRRVLGPVPYPPGLTAPQEQCSYRLWTLGEILTAVLRVGYRISAFEESPDWDEPRLPGLFTLVADRG
jgi:2-polyprenyl-3-methyl-5-hydroxy-6-metoxy-1,4-benzoquinol methylase